MLGHLPSGFLGGKNRVIELQAFNRHNVKRARTHIYKHTHTTECTKAAKATTPSACCHPRLEGVSVRPLSHLCGSGRQASVTPRRKQPRTDSLSATQVILHKPEHNHLPCCISIQLRHRCSFNCYGLLEGIIMEIQKKGTTPIYFHCALYHGNKCLTCIY